jgi:hypothetical protein
MQSQESLRSLHQPYGMVWEYVTLSNFITMCVLHRNNVRIAPQHLALLRIS